MHVRSLTPSQLLNRSGPRSENKGFYEFTMAIVAMLIVILASKLAWAQAIEPRRIGEDFGRQVAELPDWNGQWSMMRHPARLMFDPENAYLEPDPGMGLDFGIVGGSYLTDIPYKPEYQDAYMERVALQKAGMPTDPVGVGCRPYGMPRVMGATPRGPLFMIGPELILIALGDEVRRIFMDGRPHPTGVEDAILTFWGHSVGQWDGDALVIDTVNIFEGNYDQSDARHSDQIHVIESIRQVDENTLENKITITDPVMFTEPWVVTRYYIRGNERYPNLVSSNCGPDEQVEMVNGIQVQRLPFE